MTIHEGSRVRLAAATGRFRAAWQEMVPWEEANGNQHVAVTVSQVKFAWDSSYTGDSCSTCGTMKLRRAGTCLCCDNCGSTTGCS